jgi:uncharacterized protein (TIGR03435 family)
MKLRATANLLIWAVATFAQTPAPPPSFEVASVKPADPANTNKYALMFGVGTCSRRDPGQLTCTNSSLLALILTANNLTPYQSDQVVGPPWLDHDKYDVVAKVPPRSTKEQVNAMILNLLAERFGLALHRETRDLPVYELTVAKGGTKMREAEKPAQATQSVPAPTPLDKLPQDKDGLPVLPPGVPRVAVAGNSGVSARTQSIAGLVRLLQSKLDRPVVDKTGLTGTYDFTLAWAPQTTPGGFDSTAAPEPPFGQGVPAAPSPSIPDLLASVESQLGLKLAPVKRPVSVFVIDHANRTPSEN